MVTPRRQRPSKHTAHTEQAHTTPTPWRESQRASTQTPPPPIFSPPPLPPPQPTLFFPRPRTATGPAMNLLVCVLISCMCACVCVCLPMTLWSLPVLGRRSPRTSLLPRALFSRSRSSGGRGAGPCWGANDPPLFPQNSRSPQQPQPQLPLPHPKTRRPDTIKQKAPCGVKIPSWNEALPIFSSPSSLLFPRLPSPALAARALAFARRRHRKNDGENTKLHPDSTKTPQAARRHQA
jgi:hypothetical protein